MEYNAIRNIESVIMNEENARKRTEHETFNPKEFSIEKVHNIARTRINKIAYDVLQEIINLRSNLPSLDMGIPNIKKIESGYGEVYAIGYSILDEEKEPNIIVEYFEKTDNPNLNLRLTDELRSGDAKR